MKQSHMIASDPRNPLSAGMIRSCSEFRRMIRLGMGKAARQVRMNIHKTLAEHPQTSEDDKEYHARYISILTDRDRQINLSDGETTRIGDFEITPFMVDHSAYDAYMFVIKAEGKVIVHTGDYRSALGSALCGKFSQSGIG